MGMGELNRQCNRGDDRRGWFRNNRELDTRSKARWRAGQRVAKVLLPHHVVRRVHNSVAVAVGIRVRGAEVLSPDRVVVGIDRAVVVIVTGQREAVEREEQLRPGISAPFLRGQLERRECIVDILAIKPDLAGNHERDLLIRMIANEVGDIDRQLTRGENTGDFANDVRRRTFAGDEVLAERVRIGFGNSSTGAFWSYGTSGSPDRALGSLSSNTLATATTGSQYMGLRLTNTTGVALTNFTLSYDGEQWRDGGAATPNAQSLLFAYKTTNGAANLQDTDFTSEPLLNFTSPVFTNTGGGAAVVGNTAGKVSIGPVKVWVNWAPGDDLWIRWADLNDNGSDHGLAIDNVSFSADVPEPATFALLMVAAFGLLAARRVG